MTTIVTRAGKGSELTWTEADNNFSNLNSNKLEVDGSLTVTGALNMGGNQINNVATPSATADVVTKGYVDGLGFAGANVKARGRVSSGGTLQTGSYGVASTSKAATGRYKVILSSAWTDYLTAQVIATAGALEGLASITYGGSSSTFTVNIHVSGSYADGPFAFLVFDEYS